jgi:predicted HicB family RNase H-like nuclease
MKAKATKEPAAPETVKTTLRLPVELWDRIQHRAIDEKLSLQQIAERALEEYLKAGKK